MFLGWEMTQRLGAQTALEFHSQNHSRCHTTARNASLRGPDALFWPFQVLHSRVQTHRDTAIYLKKKKYFQGKYSKCHLCFASMWIFMIKVITTRWLVFNVLCNEKYTGRSQLVTGTHPRDSSFLCNLSISSVGLPAGYLQVAQCVTWPKTGTPYVCLL